MEHYTPIFFSMPENISFLTFTIPPTSTVALIRAIGKPANEIDTALSTILCDLLRFQHRMLLKLAGSPS